MRRLLTLSLAALCFGLAGVLLISAGLPERAPRTNGLPPVAPEVGAFAPPLTLTTASGDMLSLEALRGQPVVLNFWATWCEPCVAEMPALQALHRAGVRVVGVNLGESPETVQAWAATLGLSFDLALDPDRTAAAAYQLRGQPSTYVIAPDGIITAIYYGAADLGALQQLQRP